MKQLILEKKDLKPSQPNFEILGVFNPAITKFQDDIIMIARVSESACQDDSNHYKVPILSQDGKFEIVSLPKDNPNYDFSDLRVIKNHKKNYLTSLSHFRVGSSNDGVHFNFKSEDIILPLGPYEEYGIEDPRITKLENTFYIT